MIRQNDLRRLTGYTLLPKKGKHRNSPSISLQQNQLYANELLSLLPEPFYSMSAFYTAAYQNDLTTIQSLAEMKVNPNIRQEDTGLTALHIAVLRKHSQVVQLLLDRFVDVINIQEVDYEGNTALHLAAMKGYVEIVAILCDEPSCDPEAVLNNANYLAKEVVANHECYQYIHVCTIQRKLQDELYIAKEMVKQQENIRNK